jgi:hypothetical protein
MGQFPENGFSHPFVDMFTWNHRTMFRPRCLDEQTIDRISQAIRAKPDWQRKSEDEAIVSRWRDELKGQSPVRPPPPAPHEEASDDEDEPTIKESLIDYALQELEHYKHIEKLLGEGTFVPGVDEHVFVGKNPVGEDLKKTLKEQVVKLLEENKPKDWHPGSDEQVLDLVHPSLYPLQYQITPVLPEDYPNKIGIECGLDRLKDCAPMPAYSGPAKKEVAQYGISTKFQWLPAIFDVDRNGKVQIESYINGLHPKYHRELYEPIARVFERAIPGINGALTVYGSPQRIRFGPVGEYCFYTYPKSEEDLIKELGDDGWEDMIENDVDIFRLRGKPFVSEPKWDGIPELTPVDIRDFKLKVIVKLANIHLTPEKPEYTGGTWHVEGQINEDIVATILYYYDSENITDSRLAFRVSQEQPQYEQNDTYGVRKIYGLKNDDVLSLPIGSVQCNEDNVVVFPNCFQHQVQPFSLADKTKPGHRKILCFFICDPTDKTVVASDRVPAQHGEWWAEDVTKTGSLDKLPPEIVDNILSKVDWPKDFVHAKAVREELMKERSSSSQGDEYDHPYNGEFSLCEH